MNCSLRLAIVFSGAAVILSAQDTPPPDPARTGPPPAPVLENAGKPMVVPFQCSMEDILWAGLSCTEEAPCPIYLDLTAAASAGDKYFAAGNIHAAQVTLYSVLLQSDDLGRTWREPHPRVRASGLDFLQFADASNGWAAGQVLFPLPQDPFVIHTADGGKTWKLAPVLSESSESRFGSILQFHFGSPEAGGMVVDHGQGEGGGRYGLFESANGGETWNIKEESNKLLKLKTTAPASDWRVRADGPSSAFHLEHRSGTAWTSRASFAVKLGSCKPPE